MSVAINNVARQGIQPIIDSIYPPMSCPKLKGVLCLNIVCVGAVLNISVEVSISNLQETFQDRVGEKQNCVIPTIPKGSYEEIWALVNCMCVSKSWRTCSGCGTRERPIEPIRIDKAT